MKLKLLLIITLSMFIFASSVSASPIRGATMSWRPVNTDTFAVIITVWADCRYGTPTTPILDVINCNAKKTSSLCKVYPGGIDITNVPTGQCDYCSNTSCTFGYGIKQYSYIDTIVLKSTSCCDYTLQYIAKGGRSSMLTTGGAGTSFMIRSHINICNAGSVPSSYLTGHPTFIYSGNNCLQTNYASGSDPRSDSFIYRLVCPLDSIVNPITYKSGYSYLQPLKNSGSSCLFRFDTMKCSLNFNASNDNTLLAISTEHWYRTGPGNKFVKTDDIMMELDLDVITAPANSQTFMSPLDGVSDTVHICPNVQFCGTIKTSDNDAKDTIKLKWNNNIPGASFTVSPKYPLLPTGTFCWRPNKNDVCSMPYTAIITAYDNHVPKNSYDKLIVIYVDSVRFKVSVIDSGCGNIYASIDPLYPSVRDSIYNISISPSYYKATGKPNLFKILKNGTYTVSFSTQSFDDTMCRIRYNLPIKVGNARISILGKDTTICKGDSIVLKTGKAKKYNWTPAKYLSDASSASPKAFPDVKTEFYLTYTDSNNCTAKDSIQVNVIDFKISAGSNKVICFGDSTNLSASIVTGSGYHWSPATSLATPDSYKTWAKPSATTTYKLLVINPTGCARKDSVTVFVNHPIANAGKDQTICPGDSTQLSGSGGKTYSWAKDATLSNPDIANPWVKPTASNNYYLTVKDSLGCASLDTVKVSVSIYKIIAGTARTICLGDSAPLSVTQIPGATYLWTPSATIQYKDSAKTSARPSKTTSYKILVKNIFGCPRTDSVTITVSHPTAIAGKDKIICKGDSVQLSASGGASYHWTGDSTISKPTVSNPWVKPAKTTRYFIKVQDLYGCPDTASQNVKVNSFSYTISGAGTYCYGDTAYLNISGGNTYLWKPGTGLSSTKSSSPKANPSSTTTYIALISDSTTGCTHKDSVKVTVDKDCVWPGDANNDKIVDYKDILEIGLAYGSSGSARATTSIAWQAFQSGNWSSSTKAGINYKHIDCDGDGKIGYSDTSAVMNNYSLTHPKSGSGSNGKSSDPPLYFIFAKDTFYAGDTVMAWIVAGTSNLPLNNVCGIGLSTNYHSNAIANGTAKLSRICDYLCDPRNINFIRQNNASQSADLAIVRTNGLNYSGNGFLFTLQYVLKDTLQYSYPSKGTKIYARILGSTILDKDRNNLAVNMLDDSALVFGKKDTTTSGLAPQKYPALKVMIYPNPANDQLFIECPADMISSIIIYNAMGQEMNYINKPEKHLNKVSVSGFSPGIYYVSVKTENGFAVKKVIIQR